MILNSFNLPKLLLLLFAALFNDHHHHEPIILRFLVPEDYNVDDASINGADELLLVAAHC